MGTSWTKEGFIRSLDELGESEVRSKLASKVFNPEKTALVQTWLWERERAREAAAEARSEVSMAAQLRIANSAKNAAWAAAIIAIGAMAATIVVAIVTGRS